MVLGEWVDTPLGYVAPEAGGRCRESREVRQECAGLSLLGEGGEQLRPDPKEELVPPLAKEVVEPSLAVEWRAEDKAGEDCDG